MRAAGALLFAGICLQSCEYVYDVDTAFDGNVPIFHLSGSGWFGQTEISDTCLNEIYVSDIRERVRFWGIARDATAAFPVRPAMAPAPARA